MEDFERWLPLKVCMYTGIFRDGPYNNLCLSLSDIASLDPNGAVSDIWLR